MVRLVVPIAVAALAAGCGSGAADKAGGSSAPVVLRLANSNNSDQPDTGTLEHFAAQVRKRSGGSLRVRITAEGVKRIKPVWDRFARMSANLLQGIPERLLEAHYRVNEEISARVRARRQSAQDFSVNT